MERPQAFTEIISDSIQPVNPLTEENKQEIREQEDRDRHCTEIYEVDARSVDSDEIRLDSLDSGHIRQSYLN